MKKLVVGIVSALIVVVGFAVMANPVRPTSAPATPPVDAPPPRPIPPETPRREFPIGHPANPESPRPR